MRDQEESRLNRALNKCWRGESFDHERASHVIPGYAVEMFDVVYAAYRTKTGYKVEWLSEIVNEVIYRTFVVYDNFNTYGKPSLRELSKALEKALLSHFQNSPKYAPIRPLPPPSSYSRAGIDMASASPLLAMVAAQGPVGSVTAVPTPAARKSRFPSQVKSESAARKVEDYMNKRGLNQTQFATKASMTDRTLRNFLKTGVARRSTLDGIASAMGITKEDLLS